MTYPHDDDEFAGTATTDADGYDWGSGQQATPAATADDFEIPDVVISNRDANEIEKASEEREYRRIEPGDHELIVVGFVKAPKEVSIPLYIRGQKTGCHTHQAAVRLAKVDDRQASIIDYFTLPPADEESLKAYLEGSKNPDGNNPGFHSEKFGYFIARLGWPYPKGGRLPAEARILKNWKGRRIHATVEFQREAEVKIDPKTNEPYPPRTQIKLFSYRPHDSTVQGQVASQPSAHQQPTQGHSTARDSDIKDRVRPPQHPAQVQRPPVVQSARPQAYQSLRDNI